MNIIYRLLKLNRIIKSHRLKYLYVFIAHVLGIRHLFVRLDPVFACNLRCVMCHFSIKAFVKENAGVFTEQEIIRIAELFFKRTLQLYIGCQAEPTLYKDFTSVIKLAKEYGVPFVGVVTNGQLLNVKSIEECIENKLDELTISIHGVKKETYERFMKNASYDKLHEVVTHICGVRARCKSVLPQIRVNYTVNPDNLEELYDFFDIFGKYNINTLQVRPIMDWGETEYKTKDFGAYITRYNEIILELSKQCKLRNMVLLANVLNPTYTTKDLSGAILPAVIRHIKPTMVWKPDFDWKNVSYSKYCRRIKWNRYLLKSVCIHKKTFEDQNMSAQYDIRT